MANLKHYNEDGANYQAKAVLAFLQARCDIEESWNKEYHKYDAEPEVARWENCREQGYVVSMRAKNNEQINIAFFEHRNSDSICAVKWEQSTINAPTIDTAKFGKIYKTKFDVSHSVGYGKVVEMADWIKKELDSFWSENLIARKLGGDKD